MTFEFDLITSIAITLLLLIAGSWAAGNLRIFSRFSIPGPVIGGFAFALLVLILRQTGVAEIKVDTSLQSLAMLAFFTTIGLGASLGLVKKGGKILIIYLVACWTVAIFQNLIGIGLAKLLGIAPMLGIMAGAVSLEGGHGAAAAFGVTAAEMGYENASTVAIAAATFGLIAGSLTGGPLATWLINRNKLKIETKDIDLGSVDQKKHEELDAGEVIIAGGIIAVVIVAGVALGEWFADVSGYSLPGYVGAMLIAIIIRNINDKLGWIRINDRVITMLSTLALGFFLTQAMMSLKIWELYDLAGPLLIILFVQVAVLAAFVAFVVFRMMGRDYDAAVIAGGMMGHGMGATPNAIANMDAVGRRFGLQSRMAMIVVPLAGAVLIDIVAMPWIVFCMNWVG